MRGGVLADTAPAQRISYPLDFLTNERHFGMPHLESMPRARKAKRPYRATRKPRAAILAHHELSQMMSPMNPTQHMDAFAKQAAMAASPQPTKTYQGHVDSFFNHYPQYNGILPFETAYFLDRAQMQPGPFFRLYDGNFFQHIAFINKNVRADLVDVFEDFVHSGQVSKEDIPKLQEIYNEAIAPFHRKLSTQVKQEPSTSQVKPETKTPVKDELFDRDPYSPYKEPTTPSGMAPYTLP